MVRCASTQRSLLFPTIFYLDANEQLVSYKFKDQSIVDLEVPSETKEIYISNKGYISTVVALSEKSTDGYIVNLIKYKRNN